jgi:hypothetical protein
MLATPIKISQGPPHAIKPSPATNAAANTAIIARRITSGRTQPAATARKGPTRVSVSAPFM